MLPRHSNTPSLTIDRSRAEFADRAGEVRFIRHFLPERNAQPKASLLFAAAFYTAFAATDFATLGDTAIVRRPASVRVSIRAACSAQALAERIRAAFADAPGTSVKATASFGIASVPAHAAVLPASSEAPIGAADAQLHAAKRGGRNMVRATLA